MGIAVYKTDGRESSARFGKALLCRRTPSILIGDLQDEAMSRIKITLCVPLAGQESNVRRNSIDSWRSYVYG